MCLNGKPNPKEFRGDVVAVARKGEAPLAMVAEFEADLISMRTRVGMKVAKAKGRLRGKQPKLSKIQSRHLVELNARGAYTTAELFSVSRATVCRTIYRELPPPNDPQRPFARTALHRLASHGPARRQHPAAPPISPVDTVRPFGRCGPSAYLPPSGRRSGSRTARP